MLARLALVVSLAVVLPFAAPAAAQKFDPGSKYVCPNNSDTGLDCYLDAVVHLYTMCRHVKSIEIIEFGLPKAQEGVNGAKSEYCVDKQKINITRPYQAALRESTGWREAIENLRTLQQLWLDAMVSLRWNDEPTDAYEERIIKMYDELGYRIEAVRVSFSTPPDGGAATAVAVTPRPKAKTAPKATATAKAN